MLLGKILSTLLLPTLLKIIIEDGRAFKICMHKIKDLAIIQKHVVTYYAYGLCHITSAWLALRTPSYASKMQCPLYDVVSYTPILMARVHKK